jgi:hypothetical protein
MQIAHRYSLKEQSRESHCIVHRKGFALLNMPHQRNALRCKELWTKPKKSGQNIWIGIDGNLLKKIVGECLRLFGSGAILVKHRNRVLRGVNQVLNVNVVMLKIVM